MCWNSALIEKWRFPIKTCSNFIIFVFFLQFGHQSVFISWSPSCRANNIWFTLLVLKIWILLSFYVKSSCSVFIFFLFLSLFLITLLQSYQFFHKLYFWKDNLYSLRLKRIVSLSKRKKIHVKDKNVTTIPMSTKLPKTAS